MKTTLQRIRMGAMLLVLVVVASIFGFHLVGGYGWLEAIWMVVITISTVGFGERSSLPPSIQIMTICVVLFGVSAAVYTCGGLIQLALAGEIERAMGIRKMTKEISKLTGHVIICGFGRLGQDLAAQLRHRRIPFVAIDLDVEPIRVLGEGNIPAIQGDATDDDTLLEANLVSARALVTALPSDAQNVFITLSARNLRPDLQIIAKAEQESSCVKLRQAGANKIVMPHRAGAQQMERMISRPTTADLFELFAEVSQLDLDLDEYQLRPENAIIGQPIADIGIHERYDLLIVAIYKASGERILNPPSSHVIQENDTLLVMGKMIDIDRMKAEFGG